MGIDQELFPSVGNVFSTIAQGLAGDNPGLRSAATTSQQWNQDAIRNIEYQKAIEKQKKEKKKAGLRKILGTIGSVAGSFIGGPVGPVIGAAIGGTAGDVAGQAIGGGGVDFGSALMDQGLPALAGGAMMSKFGGTGWLGKGTAGIPGAGGAAVEGTAAAAGAGTNLLPAAAGSVARPAAMSTPQRLAMYQALSGLGIDPMMLALMTGGLE